MRRKFNLLEFFIIVHILQDALLVTICRALHRAMSAQRVSIRVIMAQPFASSAQRVNISVTMAKLIAKTVLRGNINLIGAIGSAMAAQRGLMERRLV
jgi:hypothetical protein